MASPAPTPAAVAQAAAAKVAAATGGTNPMGNPGGNFSVMGTPGGNLGAQGGNFGAPTMQLPAKTAAPTTPASIAQLLASTTRSQVPQDYNGAAFAQQGYTPQDSLPTAATPGETSVQQLMDSLAQQAAAYQAGTPAYSTSGGSSIVQTGPDLAQILSMLGLDNNTAANNAKTAASQTNLSINPKEDAIRTLISQLGMTTANQETNLETGAQQARGDIQGTFGDLASYLKAATDQGNAGYQQALAGTNAGNTNTQNALAALAQQGRQNINAEQSRLGLQGVGDQQFEGDQSFLQGLAALNKNNAANTLGQQQANYGGTQAMLGESQQQAGAQAQNAVLQKLVTAITAAEQQKAVGDTGYNQQIASLEGTRGDQTAANLAALTQNNSDSILKAITAAAAGQKVVSGGSTHVGAVPASGLNADQYDTQALKAIGLSDAEAKQVIAAQNQASQLAVSQQNSNINLAKLAAPNGAIGVKPGTPVATILNQLIPGLIPNAVAKKAS